MKITKPDRWSYSKLSTFSQCPRKARLRYLDRVRTETPEFFLVGRAVHTGQEHDNRHKLEHGKEARKAEVLDRAVEAYREEGGSETDLFARDHRKHLDVWHGSEAHKRIVPLPGTVESSFEVDLTVAGRRASVSGFIDVVSKSGEKGREIVDYKCVGRPPSPAEVAGNLQLALYGMGAEAQTGRLVSFVKHVKQHATVRVSEGVEFTQRRTDQLLRWIADTVRAWRVCERSGSWPKCSPSCYWCSPKACEYHHLCYPEGHDPRLHQVVKINQVVAPERCRKGAWRK